jgi:hypothetical protein
MASMGFTQESVKELMNLLDSQKEMDEKTYIELSNAAKYLYEKTGNNVSAVQTAPPPTPDVEYLYQAYDSDSDSGLGPSAVGRSINRRVENYPGRVENEIALQLVIQMERENALRIWERALAPPQQIHAVPRSVTAQPTVSTRQVIPARRLCGRHKVRGLIKLLRQYPIPIPDRSNSNITTYVQTLYDLAVDVGISDERIRAAYYEEKREELNTMTPRSRAQAINLSLR